MSDKYAMIANRLQQSLGAGWIEVTFAISLLHFLWFSQSSAEALVSVY